MTYLSATVLSLIGLRIGVNLLSCLLDLNYDKVNKYNMNSEGPEEYLCNTAQYQSKLSYTQIITNLFYLLCLYIFLKYDLLFILSDTVSALGLHLFWITILYCTILILILRGVSLPLALLNFKLKKDYKLLESSYSSFLTEYIKTSIYFCVVCGMILGGLSLLYNSNNSIFWYILITCSFLISFLFSKISRLFSLISKQNESLMGGKLRDELINIATKEDVNITKIIMLNGIASTNLMNAYTCGSINKTVVFSKNIVDNLSHSEIKAIFLHEITHYKNNDLFKDIIFVILSNIICLSSFYFCINTILNPILGDSYIFCVKMLLFVIMYSPINLIQRVIYNYMSRQMEYNADDYSAKICGTDTMISALNSIAENNLSQYHSHPFSVWLYNSHPTYYSRIIKLQGIKNL